MMKKFIFLKYCLNFHVATLLRYLYKFNVNIGSIDPMISSLTLSPLDYQLELPNQRKILVIYAVALLMYTVASPDRDTNPRRGGQLPNPKSAILCYRVQRAERR